MKRWILYSVVFILFLSYSDVYTQEPYYRHYDIEDGLPSNEIYHVMQDKKGYIWIATDKGVSRFDGYEFENFDLEDGLPDNTIFEIYEDYKGRIWFVSFSLKLSYYYQGEIHRYQYNDILINSFYKNRVQNKFSFHIDKEDNLYIGIRNYGVIKIGSGGNIKRLNKTATKSLNIHKIENRFLVSRTRNDFEDLRLHKDDSTFYINKSINKGEVGSVQTNNFIIQKDGYFIFAHDRKLFQLDFKTNSFTIKNQFDNNVLFIAEHENNYLWVSTSDALFLLNLSNDNIERTFLGEHYVTSICKDKEGSYWFSTRDAGLYYTSYLDLIHFDKKKSLPSDNIEGISVDSSGVLWLGYDKPFISKYYNGEFQTIKISTTDITGFKDLEYDYYNDRILISRNNGFYSYKKNKLIRLKDDALPLDILPYNDSVMFLASAEGLVKYQDDRLIYHSCYRDSFCMRIMDIYKGKHNTIYLGGLDGLWAYRDNEFKHMGEVHKELYYRITDIERLGEYLVMSTQGAGLLFISEDGKFNITDNDGLLSNSINEIIIDGKLIWVGTNKGLSRVCLFDHDKKLYNILNLTTDKGLPYPQVNDIEIYDSLVYVATKKGLTYFSKGLINANNIAPNIFIDNIKINGVDTTVKASYELDFDQDYLSFSYVGLAYRTNGEVKYRYKLSGLDTNWHYTKKTSKSFMGLPPGNYTFTVMARNEDGIWSDNPQSISFKINKPFYKTFWFIGLVTVFVAGIIIFFVYYRLRMIRKRNALMQDINEYKQKILRQQMNPHFIFNTLNSIQYFLLDEDTTSSLTYLTKFAKMMRIILDNSQHTFVPIEDEVRGLDLYLELEALRFEESFDYEIKIDKKINPFEYKIPALLLQPYVENSIRHGLLHKKDKGFLKVEITLNDDSLFCLIEDNGIGRKRAEEIKMTKGPMKKSLGSKITEDRIKVLNSLYSSEIDVNYVDLTDSDGNSNGTRVEIKLPFIF